MRKYMVFLARKSTHREDFGRWFFPPSLPPGRGFSFQVFNQATFFSPPSPPSKESLSSQRTRFSPTAPGPNQMDLSLLPLERVLIVGGLLPMWSTWAPPLRRMGHRPCPLWFDGSISEPHEKSYSCGIGGLLRRFTTAWD